MPREDQLARPLQGDVAIGVPGFGIGHLVPLAGPLLAADVGPQLIRLYVLDGERLDRLRQQALASFPYLHQQAENGLLLGPRDPLDGPDARPLTQQVKAEQRPVQRQAQVDKGPLGAFGVGRSGSGTVGDLRGSDPTSL